MKTKLSSWTRLLSVQRQMVQLAEGRLAELLHRQRTLEERQRELVESFGADERLAGLFMEIRAKRIRAVSKSLDELRPVIAAAELQVLEHAKRRRGIELRLEAVRRDHRAEIDRRELSEIIDAALGKDFDKPPVSFHRHNGSSLNSVADRSASCG